LIVPNGKTWLAVQSSLSPSCFYPPQTLPNTFPTVSAPILTGFTAIHLSLDTSIHRSVSFEFDFARCRDSGNVDLGITGQDIVAESKSTVNEVHTRQSHEILNSPLGIAAK
jgi:hypothetical protein